jgi:hypothetical protein
MSPSMDPVSRASNRHAPRGDVGLNLSCRPNRQRVVVNLDGAFDAAVDDHVFRADQFALEDDRFADPRDGASLIRGRLDRIGNWCSCVLDSCKHVGCTVCRPRESRSLEPRPLFQLNWRREIPSTMQGRPLARQYCESPRAMRRISVQSVCPSARPAWPARGPARPAKRHPLVNAIAESARDGHLFTYRAAHLVFRCSFDL